MKKYLALLWIGLLFLGLLLFNTVPMVDCPQTEDPTHLSTSPSQDPTVPPEEPRCYLYMKNPTPLWQTLAADAGVVITDNPEQATLLLLETADRVALWADRCEDLGSTLAYAQLFHWDLAVFSQGKICGIPLSAEGLGLLCDTQLLAGLFHTTAEIQNFDQLRQVVQEASAAGIRPFGVTDSATLARLLLALPGDGREFVDLYFSNGGSLAAADNTPALFRLGSTAQTDDTTDILPVCLGHEDMTSHTLCVWSSHYLCIRRDAPNQKQAFAFLDYLITPQDGGSVPIDTLQTLSPFRQARFCATPGEQKLRSNLVAGKQVFASVPDSAGMQTTVQALEVYLADPTNENWEPLKK